MQHLWNKVIPSFFFPSPTWTLPNLLYSDTRRSTEACMALVIYDVCSLMKHSAAFINSTVYTVMTRSVQWGRKRKKNRRNYHVSSGPKKGFVWLVHYQAVCVQTLNPHPDSSWTLPANRDLERSLLPWKHSRTPTTASVLLHTELITLSINFYRLHTCNDI